MKTRIALTISFACYFFISLPAQKHDYNWIFGSFTYPDGEFNNDTGNTLNFNGDSVHLGLFEKYNEIEHYSTVYSDVSGDLRFWSNGCEIFTAESQIMQGGDTLNPGLIYETFCNQGEGFSYIGAHQSMLSLPDIEHERYVYVFHNLVPWNSNLDPYEMRYSLIDIEANGGLGAVIKKGIPLVSNVTSGLMTAVKSADLKSWWVVAHEIDSENHFIFQLTSDSIIGPKINNEDISVSRNNHSESASAFSPNGDKYAIFGEADGLRIFDFDRELGELSNFQFFPPPADFEGGWVGLDFSASGRFLYTCHWRKIYQYDMWAEDIGASRVTVADWIEHQDPIVNVPTMFFKMQRAPDCRIYLCARNRTQTMHVIHHPDRKGEACMVQQNIIIPAQSTMTLPNFPNYRLGTGAVCDSSKIFPMSLLSTSITNSNSAESNYGINVFPNPSTGNINFAFSQIVEGSLHITLSNIAGTKVFQQKLAGDIDSIQLDLSFLPKGMYFYSLWHKNKIVKSDKIILIE